MRKITFLVLAFMCISIRAFAVLPNDLPERQRQSYVETSDGNVALRLDGDMSGDLSLEGTLTASTIYLSDGTPITGGGGADISATSDTQVLFNNGGVIGGDAGMTYNLTANDFTITNDVIVGGDVNATGELTGSALNISGTGSSTITSSTGLAVSVVGAGSSINFLTDGASDPQIQAGLTGAGAKIISLSESGVTYFGISPDLTATGAGTGSTSYMVVTDVATGTEYTIAIVEVIP